MRWGTVGIVAILGLVRALAWADPPPAPPPPPPATASSPKQPATQDLSPRQIEAALEVEALRVESAIASKDAASLDRLASADSPDPWRIADALLARGLVSEARAFATASVRAKPRPDTERLAAYVESQAAADPEAKLRGLLEKAMTDLYEGRQPEGLDSEPRSPMLRARFAYARASAHKSAGRRKECVAAFLACADLAEPLGWLALASTSCHQLAAAALEAGDLPIAQEGWTRQLRIATARGDLGEQADAQNQLGHVALLRGELDAALGHARRARDLARDAGDLRRRARTLCTLGSVEKARGDLAEAKGDMESGLEIIRQIGDEGMEAAATSNLGLICLSLGEIDPAKAHFERSIELAKKRKDALAGAKAWVNLGALHSSLSEYDDAAKAFDRAAELARGLGDDLLELAIEGNRGEVALERGDLTEARSILERALALTEHTPNPLWRTRVLTSLGSLAVESGDLRKAIELHEQALAQRRAQGAKEEVAESLVALALACKKLGDEPRARDLYQEGLALCEAMGRKNGVAVALGNLCSIETHLGELGAAVEHGRRSLRLFEELGDAPRFSSAKLFLANALSDRGEVAAAMRLYEEALDAGRSVHDTDLEARALSSIGLLRLGMGDTTRAAQDLERALALHEAGGARLEVARTCDILGLVRRQQGRLDDALALHRRALLADDSAEGRAIKAFAWSHIAVVQSSSGKLEEAISSSEKALVARRASGDRIGVASILVNLGTTHKLLGHMEEALACDEEALQISREAGARDLEASALQALSALRLEQGEMKGAMQAARDAIEAMRCLLEGHAEAQAASARAMFADVYELGAFAAMSLGDAATVSFFLESGRAVALLEALGGRARLREAVIPLPLRDAEARARARQAVAASDFRRASDGAVLENIRMARSALESAEADLEGVVDRIEREAKRGAALVYPRARPLREIEAALREGEVLVVFGLLQTRAIAVVSRRSGSTLVELGPSDALAIATESVVAQDSDARVEMNAVPELTRRLVAPLLLTKEDRRILVSSEGVLSRVPFALLVGGREVASVPSGTVLALLREEPAARGDSVLALGDPDYGTPGAVAVRGVPDRPLQRLSATNAEAKAIGNVVLVEKDATEPRLRAELAKRARWRAVHFACHGLLDLVDPRLSSLALTPSPGEDGFLTAAEVLRMSVPADLVVLSACETGRGKDARGEGPLAMARAFLHAGAPRVLVSLWKVPDASTAALMVKSYELWNPNDGSPGLAPARALLEAQAYVRSLPQWSGPEHWAAWVLWGLPD